MPISKDVFSKTLADEEVILNMASGQYFGLNSVATVIWKGLSLGKNFEEIALDLNEQFEVEPEVAKADIETLFIELKQHGLLSP